METEKTEKIEEIIEKIKQYATTAKYDKENDSWEFRLPLDAFDYPDNTITLNGVELEPVRTIYYRNKRLSFSMPADDDWYSITIGIPINKIINLKINDIVIVSDKMSKEEYERRVQAIRNDYFRYGYTYREMHRRITELTERYENEQDE